LIEEEETFNGDNVLYFVVIKLAGKGGVLKREDHRRVNDKQKSKHAYIPERQACAEVGRSKGQG
jgi:hypothetical protein